MVSVIFSWKSKYFLKRWFERYHYTVLGLHIFKEFSYGRSKYVVHGNYVIIVKPSFSFLFPQAGINGRTINATIKPWMIYSKCINLNNQIFHRIIPNVVNFKKMQLYLTNLYRLVGSRVLYGCHIFRWSPVLWDLTADLMNIQKVVELLHIKFIP